MLSNVERDDSHNVFQIKIGRYNYRPKSNQSDEEECTNTHLVHGSLLCRATTLQLIQLFRVSTSSKSYECSKKKKYKQAVEMCIWDGLNVSEEYNEKSAFSTHYFPTSLKFSLIITTSHIMDDMRLISTPSVKQQSLPLCICFLMQMHTTNITSLLVRLWHMN